MSPFSIVESKITELAKKNGGLVSFSKLSSSSAAAFVFVFANNQSVRVEFFLGERALPGESVTSEQYTARAIEMISAKLTQSPSVALPD